MSDEEKKRWLDTDTTGEDIILKTRFWGQNSFSELEMKR